MEQLALVMFFIPATSANTLPALVVVTLCNLRWCSFFSTTCAYSNLHCVVVVVVVYIHIYKHI